MCVTNMFRFLLRNLFESFCVLCDQTSSNAFCDSCLAKIYDSNFYLNRLDKYDNEIFVFNFSGYDDFWREIILFLKHNTNYDSGFIVEILAEIIVVNLEKYLNENNFSNIVISYVPSSWKRRLQGKNNNYFLAKQICNLFKKEFENKPIRLLFTKLVDFKFLSFGQAGKSIEERIYNRQNSLVLLKEKEDLDMHLPSIYLIIEDVITSGATIKSVLDEIKVLLKPEDTVWILCLANLTDTDSSE